MLILDDLSTGKLENIKGHEKKARIFEEIRVVDDMVMSPTYTRDAAGMMRDILMEEFPFMIYHIANSGFFSWSELSNPVFFDLKQRYRKEKGYFELDPLKTCNASKVKQ